MGGLLCATIVLGTGRANKARPFAAHCRRTVKKTESKVRPTKSRRPSCTLVRLNLGGIIVLNSGYYSLEANVFEQLAVGYAQTETREIELVVYSGSGRKFVFPFLGHGRRLASSSSGR